MMRAMLIFFAFAGALVSPALAHIGIGSVASFAAGVAHPLSGIDHVTVMLAVGLWATLKGDRALWVWPTTFLGAMLVGAMLGIAHIGVPFVEPGVMISVVVLGLMVALAVDLTVTVGAAIIAAFALLHGHTHGAEMAATMQSLEYVAGFVFATASLHALGIGLALTLQRAALHSVIRLAGVAAVAGGLGWTEGVL